MAKKTGQLHARDHLPGGIDPVPGLIPTTPQGSYSLTVLDHPCLQHYWRGGPDDLKGGWDMTVHTADVAGVTYPHVGGTGPITGDDGGAVTNAGFGGVLPDDEGRLDYSGAGAVVPYLLFPHPWTVEVWALLTTTSDLTPGVFSQDLLLVGGVGGITLTVFTDNKMYLGYGGVQVSAGFPQGAWVHVVGRHTGSLLELILGGVVVDSVASSSAAPGDSVTWLNLPTGPNWEPWNGSSADLAIYDCALSDGELAGHRDIIDATGSAGAGEVLTSDGDGGYSFQPPGVEVSHGDGSPDDTPVTVGTVGGGGPPWNPANHYETAVLFDSSPARFDVPSRQWVRVPFNTVRIWRTWETDDDRLLSAWLPDDRDAGRQAKDGILHVGAAMAGPQTVSGWYVIEYPVLDPDALPNDPDPPPEPTGFPDSYNRAERVLNLSDGQVLRTSPGNSYRYFSRWPFAASHGPGEISFAATADNPFPFYDPWPARPLQKPLPYPALTPAASLDWYLEAGVVPPRGPGWLWWNLYIETELAAGANLCLQAWQDSPWLLRFTTNHFPNYDPSVVYNIPAYEQRPFLSTRYQYDPDTIDHDTGRLL